MTDSGTFTAYPSLAGLPALVRKQRKLARQLVPLGPLEAQDKAVRADIDKLLVAEGFASNEGVTVNGYDVKHNARAGRDAIDGILLVGLLVAGGVDSDFALETLAAATSTGDPSNYATVQPVKGAKVRK